MRNKLLLLLCCLHSANSALDPNARPSQFHNLTTFHAFIINLDSLTPETSTLNLSTPPPTDLELEVTTSSGGASGDETTGGDTSIPGEGDRTTLNEISTLSTATVETGGLTSEISEVSRTENPGSTTQYPLSTTIFDFETSESQSTVTIATSSQFPGSNSQSTEDTNEPTDSFSGSVSTDVGTSVVSTDSDFSSSEPNLKSSTVNSNPDTGSSQNTESTFEDLRTSTTNEPNFKSSTVDANGETSVTANTETTLEDFETTSTSASTTSSSLDDFASSSDSDVSTSAPTTVTLPSSATVNPQTNPILSTSADKTSVSTANRVSTASEELPTETVRPPILVNPIEPMGFQLGTAFKFLIPDDTFFDTTDGNTRFLDVTVTTVANDPLLPDFWLQFVKETQTLHGLPLTTDDVPNLVKFAITATNSAGASTRHTFEIKIDKTSIEDVSHEFQATFAIRHQNIVISRMYLISLVQNLTDYFNDDDAESLSITAIYEGSVILTWTNNTLPKGECMNNTLTELYSLLHEDGRVNPAFRNAMEPDFPVSAVNFFYRGICAEFEASTAPSTSDDDDSIVLLVAILIPLLIVALLIFICACYLFGFFRCCDSQNGKYHPDEEMFVNRKPVILPDEFVTQPFEKSRKYPVIIPSDLTFENLAFEAELPEYEPPSFQKSFSSVSSSKADSLLDESSFPSTSSSVNVPTPEYKVPPAYLSPVSTSSA